MNKTSPMLLEPKKPNKVLRPLYKVYKWAKL